MDHLTKTTTFDPPASSLRRTKSRSPARPHRTKTRDDQLRVRPLSPTTVIRAFANGGPSGGLADITDDAMLLGAVENASASEKELAMRVARAAQRLRSWCREIEEWGWSGGYDVPDDKTREAGWKTRIAQARAQRGDHARDADATELEFWGSLPAILVAAYEERLDEISGQIDELEMDELKETAWAIHTDLSRPSSSYSTTSVPRLSFIDDFSLLVTRTLLETLPRHSDLYDYINTWTMRLAVLREASGFLNNLHLVERAIELGRDAIVAPDMQNYSKEALDADKHTIDTIKVVLQDKVADLAVQLDKMLNAVEGYEDSLPDRWIEEFERLEVEYSNWVADSQERLIQSEVKLAVDEELKASADAQRERQLLEKEDLKASELRGDGSPGKQVVRPGDSLKEGLVPSLDASKITSDCAVQKDVHANGATLTAMDESSRSQPHSSEDGRFMEPTAISDAPAPALQEKDFNFELHQEKSSTSPTPAAPTLDEGSRPKYSGAWLTEPSQDGQPVTTATLADMVVPEEASDIAEKETLEGHPPDTSAEPSPIEAARDSGIEVPPTVLRPITNGSKINLTISTNEVPVDAAKGDVDGNMTDSPGSVDISRPPTPLTPLNVKLPDSPLAVPTEDTLDLEQNKENIYIGDDAAEENKENIFITDDAPEESTAEKNRADPSVVRRASLASVKSFSRDSVKSINITRNNSTTSLPMSPSRIITQENEPFPPVPGLARRDSSRFGPSSPIEDTVEEAGKNNSENASPVTPTTPVFEDDSGHPADNGFASTESKAKFQPDSPTDPLLDSPSVRKTRTAPSPRAPLNAVMAKRRGKPDGHATSSADNSNYLTPETAASKRGVPEDELERQISDILTTIPAHIRLYSHSTKGTPKEVKSGRLGTKPANDTSTPKQNTPHAFLRAGAKTRNQTPEPASRPQTPGITLIPAPASEQAGGGGARRKSANSSSNGDPEIKLYHLSQPGKDKPIKLFVRRVGENGERVMVRVGGGWADLGEYLRQYVEHHGRRAVSGAAGGVEVVGLSEDGGSPSSNTAENSNSNSKSGTAFSATAMAYKSDLGMPLSLSGNNNKVTSTPASGTWSRSTTPAPGQEATPLSGASQRSRKSSYAGAGEEVGLMGPNKKKGDLSGEKLEWIEDMVERARRVSGTVGVSGGGNGSARKEKEKERTVEEKDEIGSLGKAGSSRRVFLKGGALSGSE
ncbi:hypothetical protein K402DRAFT_416667 [Aulographum hederae CBS 113979]|uniref:GAR domain-containing protein n=1 Tax=Aulographum hederae CBS 113979 TaxID=1176131 RepID=A0A6G1HDQ3_9PEZI|nr:hypothetical protein K402DRAFT_416667 [Aulographum hederae CBS 113979]